VQPAAEANTQQIAMDVDPPVATGDRPLIAKLSKCPKTLHDLWREYEFGLDGYKPAKDFTPAERGADKTKYCRRNNFWVIVSELIRAGDSADRAIDKVYRVYGAGASVTQILNSIRVDKGRNGHPGLRIRQL
jgi:hypothetical protein